MGFLERLDDRVIGPKGQPADPQRMRAGHWFGVAVALAIVIVGCLASGSNNPVVWPLAGMAIGSLIFGGHRAATRSPRVSPDDVDANRGAGTRSAANADLHRHASDIVDAEQRRE